MSKEPDAKSFRHLAIHAVTFNTRGMHNTRMDLHHILNSQTKLTLLYLTESKHNQIKSIWREALKDCKLTHKNTLELDLNTNRRLAGTIFATRIDVYKDATPI